MFSSATITHVPGTPLPTYYNAMTDGPSTQWCRNDGVSDDTARLTAQANAAKAAGKTLYLPAGAGYKLVAGTPWNSPAGTSAANPLYIKGAGMGTRILGETRIASYQRWSDIFFGVSTDTAIAFNQNITVTKDVTFTKCRFRGGTTGAVTRYEYIYQEVYNIGFYNCKFEVSYFNAFTALAHSIEVQVLVRDAALYSNNGGVFDGLTLDHCHVGVPNEYGQTENKYGSILYYRHGEVANYNTGEGTSAYINNLILRNNIFEHTWNWNVDYTGNMDTDATRTQPLWSQRCIIEDNLFKGCGGHRGDAGVYENFPIGLDLEPVYYSEINRNVMYRCDYQAIKFTYSCKYCNCKDNIIDYRPVNGSDVAVYTNTSGSEYNYWLRRVIHLSGGTNITVTGNQYFMPTNWNTFHTSDPAWVGTPPTANGWIANEATNSTVSGNSVYVNNTIVDWESQMDVGCDW